jgi:hypothetical protein
LSKERPILKMGRRLLDPRKGGKFQGVMALADAALGHIVGGAVLFGLSILKVDPKCCR